VALDAKLGVGFCAGFGVGLGTSPGGSNIGRRQAMNDLWAIATQCRVPGTILKGEGRRFLPAHKGFAFGKILASLGVGFPRRQNL
jgi:hypothetical protein